MKPLPAPPYAAPATDTQGRLSIQWQDWIRELYLRVRPASGLVGDLPSASLMGAGYRSFVTDATGTTFATVVVGGGVNKVPVYSDGTNWLIG